MNMSDLVVPHGFKSLSAYAAALSLSVSRFEAALEIERAELARIRRALAVQKKAKPVVKQPKIETPVGRLVGVDTEKPLATQVQAVARHFGIKWSSVYNEKTKTKGRKIKLHLARNAKTDAHLRPAIFEAFATELRRLMADAGTIINSVELVKGTKPYPGAAYSNPPSIVVFFA